jgi:hypothetical protein
MDSALNESKVINLSQSFYSQNNPLMKSESFVSSINQFNQNKLKMNSQLDESALDCTTNILERLKQEELCAPKCFKCQEVGHSSRDCTTKERQNLANVYSKGTNKEEKK